MKTGLSEDNLKKVNVRYMKSYVNLSCDNPTTDDHSLYLSMMCLHLNGFVLESMSVESIFSLDLSEGGWGEGVEDSWLFVTAVEGAGQW